jgi:hypothetical protein
LTSALEEVVSYTPLPLYLRGKKPVYPSCRRLGAPLSRSGHYGEEKISCPYNSDSSAIQPIAKSLYQLSYMSSLHGMVVNKFSSGITLLFFYLYSSEDEEYYLLA